MNYGSCGLSVPPCGSVRHAEHLILRICPSGGTSRPADLSVRRSIPSCGSVRHAEPEGVSCIPVFSVPDRRSAFLRLPDPQAGRDSCVQFSFCAGYPRDKEIRCVSSVTKCSRTGHEMYTEGKAHAHPRICLPGGFMLALGPGPGKPSPRPRAPRQWAPED